MPDAARAVDRFPRGLLPGYQDDPGFDVTGKRTHDT
jgi:hypothetical protein